MEFYYYSTLIQTIDETHLNRKVALIILLALEFWKQAGLASGSLFFKLAVFVIGN